MNPKKIPSHSTESVIFAEPAFKKLSASDRAMILSYAAKRTVKAGAPVYRRGENPDGVYIVLKGLVRVTGLSAEGDEFILDLCGPGFWIGEIAVLEERARTHDAIAETRCELLFLSSSDVDHLLSTLNGFARALLLLEVKRFRQVADWAEQYATASLQNRLALRLIILARRDPLFNQRGSVVEMKLTQQTLARLVGTTRQRVNQVLLEWERRTIIKVSRGGLTILKPDQLKANFTNQIDI